MYRLGMPFFSRRKEPDTSEPVIAYVHLNSRLQPMHRGSVFEDPLDELLSKHAPGSEVVGGGTEFTPETGPTSCDTEVQLVGDPQETFRLVIDILEHLGAPVGSWAAIGGGERVAFGTAHGFALTLDGTSLPDEVYQNNDVNDLISQLNAELGKEVELQSWWEGSQSTSLYYYGKDAQHIRRVLESAADRYPLARNSRAEAITGA